MVTVLLQILELASGPLARPLQIRLASRECPSPTPEEWSDIEIVWGSSATEIVLDANQLLLPVRSSVQELDKHHQRNPNTPISAADIDYIVDRLLWSGSAKVELAARELGFSSSTLKRRLSENGRSFSEIVGNRRQFWAEQLLSETTTSLADIASTLGYAHLSNFSRAFKARSGMSPGEFRAARERK